MKVAVIGGNFLGCATAYYVRRALEENSIRNATKDPASDTPSSSVTEVHIFEASSRLGGNKFDVRSIPGVERSKTPTGSAAEVDIGSCPLFKDLIESAQIHIPSQIPSRNIRRDYHQSYGLFHWDQDEFRVIDADSRLLMAASESSMTRICLRIYALLAVCWILYFMYNVGVRTMYRFIEIMWYQPFPYYAPLLFVTSLLLGCGVVPLRPLLKFYNFLLRRALVTFTLQTTYGPDQFLAYAIAKKFQKHLKTIAESKDVASSAVSLGHLLSRCGLVQYCKKSTAEYFRDVGIGSKYASECVEPFMMQDYGDSTFVPNLESNSLVGILALSSSSRLPRSLRSQMMYLNTEETESLCPKLAESANAHVHLSNRVLEVLSDRDVKEHYALSVKSKNGEKHFVTGFNAVIICGAVCRDGLFSIPNPERPIEAMLGTNSFERENPSTDTRKRRGFEMYSALVQGILNPSFFNCSKPDKLPDQITILKSLGLNDLRRVSSDIYHITCTERPTETSGFVVSLFESVKAVVSWQRPRRQRNCGKPIRILDSDECPDLILQKRLINANCIDRLGSHIELDCISARNTASLLKDDTVQWK